MVFELNQAGHGINRKRVQRLMRVMGIEALVPRPGTSKAAPGHRIYPYLLRGVSITEPNHVWASDITYIPMALGFLYLVAIIDWASRAVLAWRLSNTMDTGFCIAALDEALARHGAPKIFNTDQGTQFTSAAFSGRLEAAGIAISMDGRGRFMDNIFIERLWRSIKYEEVHLKAYADGREARDGIGSWMNFYNHRRPHQAMNNQFPMAAWRAGTDRIEAAKTVDMPLRLDNANALPTYHSRRKSSSRKLLDLKDKGRRDHTLTSAIPGPSSGVHFSFLSSASLRFACRAERSRPRFHNPGEVEAIHQVLLRVRAASSSGAPTLVVLSPYKAQVDKLADRIDAEVHSGTLAHLVDFAPATADRRWVSTVDGFQGNEADLVVLSLVRNNGGTGASALGFLRDRRRINVGLSRAKSKLVIVGSLAFLREAVRGVNPDAGTHDLSFLTTMTDIIGELAKEKRPDGTPLAAVIRPEALATVALRC